MLDSMRGLAKSFVSKALMLFLVLTFAVWGAGDIVRGGGSNYLVKVGDEKIGPNLYMSEQRNMQQSLAAMGVQNIDPTALGNEILRRMVQQKLILQWQRDTGLMVDQATLARDIAANVEFKAVSGKFDPAVFKQALAQRGLTEASYLAALSQELGGKAMLASLESDDIAAPASVLDLAIAAGTQQRDAVLISIAPARPDAATVSEQDAADYYEQNQDRFAQPERRSIEYVTLDPKALEAKADEAVTDEANAAEQREQAMQDIAMQIEDALAGGSTIGEAVAEAGVQAQSKLLNDVAAGQFHGNKDALLLAVVEQGFTLGEGESSSLQSTADGRYFLVTVQAVTDAAPKPLADVLPQVRAAVAAEQADDATRERMAELKAALQGGKPWKEAAAEAKASAREIRNIARPASDVSGKPIAHPQVPALLQRAVFEHPVGGVAGPITRENGEQVLAVVTASRTAKADAGPRARTTAETEYKAQLASSITGDTLRALAERYPVTVNQSLLAQLNNQDSGANE